MERTHNDVELIGEKQQRMVYRNGCCFSARAVHVVMLAYCAVFFFKLQDAVLDQKCCRPLAMLIRESDRKVLEMLRIRVFDRNAQELAR
jgi:hypothetical protein